MNYLRGLPIVVLLVCLASGCSSVRSRHHKDILYSRDGKEVFDKVDIGGRRLYVDCVGNGSPTVILDSGFGDSSSVWRETQKQIHAFTRVCRYDRANLGESDPAPKPRTSQQMVEDLHALLRNSGMSGPFVLVGHSIAGFTVRLYASQYPAEILGVVLVDSSHPDQALALRALFPPLSECEDASVRGLRKEIDRWIESKAAGEEGMDIPASAAQVRTTGSMAGIPLVVLTATDHGFTGTFGAHLEETWRAFQNDLAALSSRSTHVMVSGAHYIQVEHPEAVVDAVKRIVEISKTRR